MGRRQLRKNDRERFDYIPFYGAVCRYESESQFYHWTLKLVSRFSLPIYEESGAPRRLRAETRRGASRAAALKRSPVA